MMERPDFLAGNEKRFFEFISSLGDEKIALLTHTDLDGVASGKVTNEVINADYLKFIDYVDLNSHLIEELREKEVKVVAITDIAINNPAFIKEAERYFRILIIDHHTFKEDYNSEKTVYMNAHHFCAAYLCYYLFSKAQDISKYDWLVACASISDWAYFKNRDFMKEVFEKYGDKFEFEGEIIKKSGRFWDMQWSLVLGIIYYKENLRFVFESIGENFEIGDVVKGSTEVQKEIDEALEMFDREKIEFNGGYFWEFSPKRRIGSLVSTLISAKNYNKTVIIGRPGEKYYSVSARRQDGVVNVAGLLQDLISGLEDSDAGGHFKAAGGHVLAKDRENVKERIKKL